MTIDYEADYNNSRRVPEIVSLVPQWLSRSAATRAATAGDWDVPYGPHARHRFDLLKPPGMSASTPLAVFIHGGYWQSRDRSDFYFVSEGLLAHGVAVAMPSYRLAPEVTVADIIADLRAFLAALYRHTGRRAVVTGHSAGGHLTAAMLATDWSSVDGVPQDLVRAGYALSGVFDLAPLVATSINTKLGETVAGSRAVSPYHGPLPAKGAWLTAAVGGAESNEFIRQSVDMAGHWSRHGIAAEAVIIPAANHFTILDDLARPDSAMVHRIAALAARCLAA